MDEVVTSRDAVRAAVRDIEPEPLRDRIDDVFDDASMAPGILTARCARAVDSTIDLNSLAERTAGVQLTYDGLRLTRQLVHDEPWQTSADQLQPNLDVLVADVLVSRGISLLAPTQAADKAVETVRAFGRDQTHRRRVERDGDSGVETEGYDSALEVNALQLAAIAGTTAVGGSAPRELREQIARVAREGGTPLPDAEDFLPEPSALAVSKRQAEPTPDRAVRRSATDH